VHCDTPYLEQVAPLYTFFVALQDVESNMSHTTFLPRTHCRAAHDLFNAGPRQKAQLIAASPAVQSGLAKGDVAIFDSRVLHCGGENSSVDRRSVLFYFIFTAGDTRVFNPNPSRGAGSIRSQDRFQISLRSLLP
jgi:ectoine hydroxylase-related dioxygenase (phytanoyl-CoA dioxygenase family)